MTTDAAPGRTPRTEHSLSDHARELFLRHRRGDDQAIAELVALLTPLLWHLARAYRIDHDEAKDAVQNTWVALVTHQERINDPQAVLRWLSVTVRREAARMAQNGGRMLPTQEGEIDLRMPSVDGPETHTITQSGNRALWRTIESLSPRCQRLLRIVAFSDRPDYAAISEETGMPIGSIGPTRARCLDKLRRACLADPEWSQR